MSVLTDLVTQLEKDIAKEESLLSGYNLLSISAELSPVAIKEVSEGFSYSSTRREALIVAINAIKNLIELGYPDRQMQTASVEVINELKNLLNDTKEAVNEFVLPVKLTLKVSAETPERD